MRSVLDAAPWTTGTRGHFTSGCTLHDGGEQGLRHALDVTDQKRDAASREASLAAVEGVRCDMEARLAVAHSLIESVREPARRVAATPRQP